MSQIDNASKIKQLEQACESLHKEIEALEAAHRFAVSKISHEIRNPVTLIYSSLQIIEKEHPEVQDFSLWKETMDDMQYLRRLLDELSSYNTGDALNKEPISTHEWLRQIAASFSEVINATNEISFTYYIETPLPEIMGDPIKLKQALFNLLRNAHEALAPGGDIFLTATQEQQYLCIEIRDTGCGIPKEYMKTLFDPFITHKNGGTGLGLAITKRIIETHDGSITCSSSQEQGTAFTVRLPISSS